MTASCPLGPAGCGGREGRASRGRRSPDAPGPAGSPPSARAGGTRRGAPRGPLPLPVAAHRPSRRLLGGQTARAPAQPLSPRAPAPRGGAAPRRPGPAARLQRRGGDTDWARTQAPGPGRGRRRLTFFGGVHLVWGGGGDAAARLPRPRPEPSGRGGEGGRGGGRREWSRAPAGAWAQVRARKLEEGERG